MTGGILGPPAVLVMAHAPRRGEVRRALEPVLGQAGCVALQTELIRATTAWAEAVAPGHVHVAHEPADAGQELRRLIPEASMIPQNGDGLAARVSDASSRVLARHPGPLLIVWPDLPEPATCLAEAALADLQAGCRLVLGPLFDGGLYMIAVAQMLPELFAIPEAVWRGRELLPAAFAKAAEAGLEVGMLRAERGLRRPADVRAALADPLLPPRLRAILAR